MEETGPGQTPLHPTGARGGRSRRCEGPVSDGGRREPKAKPSPGEGGAGGQRGSRPSLKSDEEANSNLNPSCGRVGARERSRAELPPKRHAAAGTHLCALGSGGRRGGVCLSVCLPSLHTPRPCLAWPEAGAGSATSPGASWQAQARPEGGKPPPQGSPPAWEPPSLGHPRPCLLQKPLRGREEGTPRHSPGRGAGAAQAAPGGARTCGHGAAPGGLLLGGREAFWGGSGAAAATAPSLVRAQLSSPHPDPAPAKIWRGGKCGPQHSGCLGREGGSPPQRLGEGDGEKGGGGGRCG